MSTKKHHLSPGGLPDSHKDLSSFYADKINDYTGRIQAIQKRLSVIGLLRLIFFVTASVAVYYLFKEISTWGIIVASLLLAAFIALVVLTFRLKDRRLLWEKLLLVNTNEAGVLKHALNQFDDGQAFPRQESYLDDLDIFGKSSLFHLLNRTTTSHGKGKLAGLLRQSMQSGEEILQYQQAIQALAPQADTRQMLTAHGLLNQEKEENLYSLSDWLASPPRLLGHRWILTGRWILVLYNIFGILFYLAMDDFRPLLAGVLAAWAMVGAFTKYISGQHVLIGRKQAILDQYAAILQTFHTADSRNAALLEQWQLQTGKAHKAIRRLSQLSAFFDQRLNALVNIILNSFFVYDIHCMIALEKWKRDNKEQFPDWIGLVGNIECLNSLATFAFNNPGYCYPVPESGNLLISAKGMAHPMIPAAERVANDFTLGRGDRLVLVTGSNMSGKTTFLRTIGVNLLLAQCGAPVCAAAFTFTPMQLLSSLRVSDSLQEHTSYFMAELKKLQQIIHHLQSGQPSLVLIDEILRGTNSEDKTYGSEQFILKLLQYNCLSLFATHDLSLGRMEEDYPGKINNYCFESVIEHGELHFNYRLERGIARNRNASFLMKKMEII